MNHTSQGLNATTLKERNTVFISFPKVSGTHQKKNKSTDSHALPQLTSSTMAVANDYVNVNNSPPYTHSPGPSLRSMGLASLSPSHDASLLLHKFTYLKPLPYFSKPSSLTGFSIFAKHTVTQLIAKATRKLGSQSFQPSTKSILNPSTSLHFYCQ